MRTQRFRKLITVMTTVACVSALSLIATSSASAESYNCGYIPTGGMCNPPVNATWGAVHYIDWDSTTAGGAVLPVRVFGGAYGSTGWSYINQWDFVQPNFHWGVAQVKNNTGRTQQLTISWWASH